MGHPQKHNLAFPLAPTFSVAINPGSLGLQPSACGEISIALHGFVAQRCQVLHFTSFHKGF